MFERFDQTSRVAIFFARAAAEGKGDTCIEAHHLLLGLLRAAPSVVLAALRNECSVAELAARLNSEQFAEPLLNGSVEIPFGPQAKETLLGAEKEANTLRNDMIVPEHILLALSSQPGTGTLLLDYGFSRARVERQLSNS